MAITQEYIYSAVLFGTGVADIAFSKSPPFVNTPCKAVQNTWSEMSEGCQEHREADTQYLQLPFATTNVECALELPALLPFLSLR